MPQKVKPLSFWKQMLAYCIVGGCWINLMADGDAWLAVFALIAFVACGVPWEFDHWSTDVEEA